MLSSSRIHSVKHRSKKLGSSKLKKYFPSICKAKMYNRVIFYLKDKKDAAVRVFDADRDIKEKLSIISRNRAEKLFLKMIN